MEVCIARASAAVVQHVPPTAVEEFEQWQRGVTAAVERFPGYQGTDLYPPTTGSNDEWVTVIHFEDDQSLQGWLNSSVRAKWVEKLRASVGEFELRSPTGGFSQWFTDVNQVAKRPTPGWKMVVTVVCALYPTVMLLSIFVGPHTSRFGLAVSMLIGNIMSVSCLQWIVMPVLTRILAPWLEANEGRRTAFFSLFGFAAISLFLAALTVLFRQTTG
jgi:antibiotic biosynthesis monooxygenase (ABM) superfamily enzyme